MRGERVIEFSGEAIPSQGSLCVEIVELSGGLLSIRLVTPAINLNKCIPL